MTGDQTRPRLTIEGDRIECSDAGGKRLWSCPMRTIVLIAEYTTDEGPWLDDYFLLFWTCEDGHLFRSRVSFYADGRDEVIAAVTQHFNLELKLELVDSTDWKSRVIWPPELTHRAYFTFANVPPSNWRERFTRWLWGPTQKYFPSDEVCGYLRRYSPEFPRQP
jgi:hypothetical protein